MAPIPPSWTAPHVFLLGHRYGIYRINSHFDEDGFFLPRLDLPLTYHCANKVLGQQLSGPLSLSVREIGFQRIIKEPAAHLRGAIV